jgi:hypothetical protein
MKREIILVTTALIVAILSSGCMTASPAQATPQTPVIKTITIQTDNGGVIVFPLCKDRVICYQIVAPGGTWGGWSCMSANTISMDVLDRYCQGNY